MSETNKKWNEEKVAELLNIVNGESPVTAATVEAAAAALNVSVRSVASKLRQLEVEVESMAKEKPATFSIEETNALREFVEANEGKFTYKELAEQFPGEFSAKQIQGKLLALELTSFVKPTEKVEVARTYTEAEEETFVKMAKAGKFIEEIAVTLGKTVPSVRGKALSLTRSGLIDSIPAQKESHAKHAVDAVAALGDAITGMTVEAIAKAVDKTERGVRTLLTRRGINVADYKGSDKKAKSEAKQSAA
jgi:transcriptional regulator with XRE-family HTH domain